MFIILGRTMFSQRILSRKTQAVLDSSLCVWGVDRHYPSPEMYSHINWAICAVFFLSSCFFSFSSFLRARMQRAVSGPSDLLHPQAVINYRHVFSAQTPPSLPLLCDKDHIIILTSNKNASAISVLEVFYLYFFSLPCCPSVYQGGISAAEAYAGCTKIT